MRYAIVGFGKIGHALAKAFGRKGIEVSVATTRDPESFASDAAAIGSTIIPKTLRRPSRRTSSSWLSVSRRSPLGRGKSSSM
jgi:predicted dinucleotide-binding enzyme